MCMGSCGTQARLLTIAEVAGILNVHRSTVSRLLKSGDLPCIRIGCCKRVRPHDLAAYVDNHIGVAAGSRDASGGVHG
jgi:excisionase family DNA binding protein